uniref:Ependymin-2-like n=1 Tax=Astyanax mexicanus TaxID=7994 RepID=A0A3B1IGD3_ASTMX
MKLLVLLSVCSCLALNAWTQPRPCGNGFSQSFKKLFSLLLWSMKDGAKTSSGMFTYDGWGQQVRFRNFETEHSTTHFTDLLMNFKQIDHASQTCKKKSLETSFHPMQVPPDSLFFGQIVLGTGSVAGMGLLANTWYGEIPQIQATYTLVFSDNACVPLSGTYSSPESGTIIIRFAQIHNFLLDIILQ